MNYEWRNKKILVTGATGFVGSHLTKKLVEAGANVSILARESSDFWRLSDVISKISVHKGDISNKADIQRITSQIKPVGIFHLGASIVISGQGDNNEKMIATNFLGTANLIDSMKPFDYEFFVMAGSFLEYGFKEKAISETERCEPGEIYGVSKLAGTLFGQAVARAEKKPVVTLRIFTPFGPANGKERLTPKIISSALRGEPLILTNPKVSRDFIYIDDLVDLFLETAGKAKRNAGEIFNAGTGERSTLEEVASYVLKKTFSASEIKWGSFRAVSYDSDKWQADMTKTFSHFNWRPKYSLERGLDLTIEHFKKFGF